LCNTDDTKAYKIVPVQDTADISELKLDDNADASVLSGYALELSREQGASVQGMNSAIETVSYILTD
jgi:hypothetical protein